MTWYFHYLVGFAQGVAATCLAIILMGRWPWNRDLYLRSHEPPRNSGEADAVNGPTALAGGDESHTTSA